MKDKKLTDNEIVKALEDCPKNVRNRNCKSCLYTTAEKFCLDRLMEDALDLINRQKEEIERLKNAYKQVAWERDIFAEDMKQEIKKDCSYLMLDIKTIKAEAYEKFIDKFLEKAISTRNYFEIKSLARTVLNELVGEDK